VNIKRRRFTFLEILIVIGVMALISGLLTINIRSAYLEQNFKGNVSKVLDLLNRSQIVLLTANVDTVIDFKQEGDRVHYQWAPSGNINQALENMVERQKGDFKGTIEWDNGAEKKFNTFQLHFKNLGIDMSGGLLKFSSDGKEAYILLPGYPMPLTVQETAPDINLLIREKLQFYEQITSNTWQDPNVQGS
jgi:hypothetical protein